MAKYNSAKQKSYDIIGHLVDNFKNGTKSKNETETRRYYIDKFFEALDWDVGNEKGKREVIHEDIVKVKGKTKFPDYGFYFKGKRVFFVEAKDTKVDIKNDSKPAFQLRSYAWSAKLGVSILTDFEELAIYDCTVRPKENDRTEAARIKYFTYEDYLKEEVFDYIYDLFERDNVANGSLDAYSENLCNRKGSETVDVHFLNTLDELRTKLAVVISKLNKEMSEKDINYAVQQIIDRIIFLRVAEDRNVENYGLLALANPKNKNEDDFKNYGFNAENSYYCNLNYIFDKANEKYNSGLFNEDDIVKNLNIDDKTIKEIIEELYTPRNPYQFSVIPVEIIGNAYEQFLGKTITIGKNHSAKIELKPEVRKAGGVYYTPEYIVDYIVANTVGEAIKGKKPEEIANIKILDPACGSGSFLLGAYKYLLNYHIEYYNKIKDRAKFKGSKEDVIKENGDLTIWIKKQILRNNIFGVDIDSNAVEVTKLSLLMKCLEGESPASIQNNQDLFNERALPSLEDNIKCGNSLIGNDFYESQSVLYFDEETQYKINCFDWEDEFKNIFKGGGFDVVIGNPPYVRIHLLDKIQLDYFKDRYSVYKGQIDLYSLFIEKSISYLSKSNGVVSFIVPRFLKFNIDSEEVRKLFLKYNIKQLVEVGKAFKNVSTECIVFLVSKDDKKEDIKIYDYYPNKDVTFVKTMDKNMFYNFPNIIFNTIVSEEEINIINKMLSISVKVSEICSLKRGMEIGKKDIRENKSGIPTLLGEEVSKYQIVYENTYCLENHKEVSRLKLFSEVEKILIRRVANQLIATYDNENYYFIKNLYSLISKDYNLKYILGLLNSKLLNFFFKKYFTTKKEDIFPEIQAYHINELPIYKIDLNKKEEKEKYDKIIELVDSMIILNKKLISEKNPNSLNMINRQISACEKQLDNLIFSIYNLNDEERRIIEGD
ncbi:fused endonuclease-methyltransferase [Brachyspira intermedia PWS/A]|uniref:site-specific DNA-methyltransferase (adenine-specific) n=1 Tax=Brachyspira intermedia (strain ATCC 51140 / PWS/A) TaxID=1045858 RepID=G0EJH0_BRAIP|nr:TaqI-like C-terminal specificity domain-containing protein [Brachyspira intermedia]AEM21169.1 fused endonuclease-methyltransferase [Brachyspira intermedia PWS/A]